MEEQKSPKVSVIVPTYRRKETLRRALISITKQTYPMIEMIVVDDNANEKWNQDVRAIVDEINPVSSDPIRLFQNKTNMGSAKARNIGIENCTGTYITFLDDDDIYLPLKIEKQIEYMQMEKLDYCISDLKLYNESNKVVEVRKRDFIRSFDRSQLMRYHLMYHLTGTDTFMFKKQYLLEIGCFTPIDIGDEFYLMSKAISHNGKFGYLPRIDVNAYVHSGTNSLSSGDNKIIGENKIFAYKNTYFKYLAPKDIRYIRMRHYAVLSYTELKRKNNKKALKYASRAMIASPMGCIKVIMERKRITHNDRREKSYECTNGVKKSNAEIRNQ